MNPLLQRLASLRRKVRLLDGWQGLCALIAVVLVAAVVAGLLDYLLHLPSLVRAMLLVGILGGACLVVYRLLLIPFSSPCDDLTLALRVEEAYPELNDALASTVQFLEDPALPSGGSEAMRKQAVQQALAKAARCDFSRVISYRAALGLGALAFAGFCIAGWFAYAHAEYSGIAMRRLAEPFGGQTWTSVSVRMTGKPNPKVMVMAEEGDTEDIDMADAHSRLAVDQPLRLVVNLTGIVPKQARVEIERKDQQRQVVDIKDIRATESEGTGTPKEARFEYNFDVKQHQNTFRYRVLAGDGAYPPRAGKWHTVEVLPPPELAPYNGQESPQTEVYPPLYTEEPSPKKMTPGAKQIEAPAGSRVVFVAAANRQLKKAWIEQRPDNPVMPAAYFSFLTADGGLGMATQAAAQHEVWHRIHADIGGDGKSFAIRFTPYINGRYLLRLEDEYRLYKEYEADLRVQRDPIPTVKVLQPSTALTLLPDADLSLQFKTEDETYALRSVFLEYRSEGAEGEKSGVRRDYLYHGPVLEKALPRAMAAFINSPIPGKDLHLRPKLLEMQTVWPLRNRFREGDTVKFEVCADDFCNIFGPREAGRSHEIIVRIVGKRELAKAIDDKLTDVQTKVGDIQKKQEEANKIIQDLLAKKETDPDRAKERIAEAQQLQREINEKIGARPDEGLREELAKLQQLIKDNKLKDTEARQQLGTLKGALEQLAQRDFPQIESALAEARNKAGQDKKDDPKNQEKKGSKEDKKDDPLDKAAGLQKKALDSMRELEKALSPWASQQQIKKDIRDILAQEQQIKQGLEKIKNENEKFENAKKENKLTREQMADEQNKLRDDLNKNAEALKELARQAEAMNKKITDTQETRAKAGDQKTVDRLKEAEKIADKAQLPAKMREDAAKIAEKAKPGKQHTPPEAAIAQQKENIHNLEQMLQALEGKNDDALTAKQEKLRKAQDNIDKLKKKQQALKKEIDDTKKIEDPEERLQKRKELAEQERKLQGDLEKQARELARLEENRAANEVAKAADEAGNAAKKLEGGENPQQDPQNVDNDLAKAKKAIEEAQEELAREQLARIADRLKGLSERQDAALERSKEFHTKLLVKKLWTEGLGDSLDGNAMTQEGLAKESDSLREKIKEAKVFEHILKRASDSMVAAAKVMRERKADGMLNRQADAMGKDELDDENEQQQLTIRHQGDASRRLKNLLEAVKEEIARQKEKKDAEAQAKKDNPEGDNEQQGSKLGSRDGISSIAELKALRGEQIDVRGRTEELARRNPNPNNLKVEQRKAFEQEVQQLERDQQNIQELFRGIASAPEKKGEAP